jgi:hypothetical protein
MEARCPRCSNVFSTDRCGMQFCPHCGQQVDVPAPPGASWGGTPPGEFGSGRFGGEPPPGGTPGSLPGGKQLTPWERRREIGLVKGFFETWKQSVFSPQTFFPTVRPDVPWTEALFYGWIVHAITVILSLPILGLGLFSMMIPTNLPSDANSEQVQAISKAIAGGMGVGPILGTLVLYPLFVIIGAAILHLFAMIFGAAKNGWGATARALCYASGPNILSFIPCVGFLAGIYVVVLEVLALMGLQETTTGKAVAVVLAPVLLVCCCAAVGIFMAVGMAGLAGMGAGSRSF